MRNIHARIITIFAELLSGYCGALTGRLSGADSLFDGHRLSKIARLVDIGALDDRDMIGQ